MREVNPRPLFLGLSVHLDRTAGYVNALAEHLNPPSSFNFHAYFYRPNSGSVAMFLFLPWRSKDERVPEHCSHYPFDVVEKCSFAVWVNRTIRPLHRIRRSILMTKFDEKTVRREEKGAEKFLFAGRGRRKGREKVFQRKIPRKCKFYLR